MSGSPREEAIYARSQVEQLEEKLTRLEAKVEAIKDAITYQASPDTAFKEVLFGEIIRLQTIIDTHNLCHDLHGKVGPEEFARGCEQEQEKVFGSSLHRHYISELERVLLMWNDFSAKLDLEDLAAREELSTLCRITTAALQKEF